MSRAAYAIVSSSTANEAPEGAADAVDGQKGTGRELLSEPAHLEVQVRSGGPTALPGGPDTSPLDDGSAGARKSIPLWTSRARGFAVSGRVRRK